MRLAEQKFGIVARSHAEKMNLVRQVFSNLYGAGADGTGRSKNNIFIVYGIMASTHGANTNTSAAH